MPFATKEDEMLFRVQGNGKMVFEIFPPEYLALDAELRTEYHPKIAFIAGYPADEIDIKIAHVAAYCEVILDDCYTIQDRVKLCGILVEKLKEKREDPKAQIIIPFGA